ncbi:hypothetical protein KUCAC02_020978 [Chaenocephalus aceratus]|uniref:Uncharacterized protein n=1 Tax=Chaenocephalus aceratus TaxID=36190 RepID=A0ACB9XGA3_CHAAC|nr:hypothetical protein KUCAC02_020978 [Chaenocephalus aceratus]
MPQKIPKLKPNCSRTRRTPPTTRQAKLKLKMDTANANAGGASVNLIASSAQAESNGKILEAIHSLRADVTTRNDEILAAISEIKTDLSSYSGRLTQAEDRIGETEDNVTVLHNTVNGMEKVITALTEKVEDLENRDRRSNLRVIGLPENAEGRDVESFLEKWIPEVLGPENFPTPLVIERAHRIPGGRPKPNSPPPPRPLIVKFLNFRDKVRVMQAARAKGKVIYGTRHIMFFPTSQRRMYTLHNGKRRVFNTPEEVESFLRDGKDTDNG